MSALYVFGTGGFARQILPLIRENANAADVRFISDALDLGSFAEFDVFGPEALAQASGTGAYLVAIANGSIREQIAQRLERSGLKAESLRSKTARIAADADIGIGAIICDFAVIEPDAQIGRHFHANAFSFVAHECRIGDFVTFGPRVTCNGNVHIGDHAYIGAGAVIRQGTPEKPLRIGKGAVVGMGAVVTKDVAPGSTVVGNPAKPLGQR